VVDLIIGQIVDAIKTGRYKIGQRLPSEYELINELKISRNSLREAMRVLSTMGIVEIRRGDGTYITDQLSPGLFDNIIYSLIFEISTDQELIELRHSLDEMVLRLAIDKADEEDVNKLELLTASMKSNLDNGKIQEAAKDDYDFHIVLAESTKNRFMARIIKGVYQLYAGSIQDNLRVEEHAEQNHINILECLKRRDKVNVAEVIKGSLNYWEKNLKI
jgi:DNA-binding FadR family transcriptional regulator